MKTLLIGLVLAISCNLVQAKEETATGYGGSFTEALQSAKVLATEYAASTFVTGKQELHNGQYKETLGQYNGGLVQKYTVLNTVVNDGVYEVTITAEVDTDKINSIIENGSDDPTANVAKVEKAIDEYEATTSVLATINNVSYPFAVVIDNSHYSVYGGESEVLITYTAHLVWNPKWVDDVKQLIRVINRPIYTSQHGICFGSKRERTYPCGGIAILPESDGWKRIKYNTTITYQDGTTETQSYPANVVVNATDLFSHNYDQRVTDKLPPNVIEKAASSVVFSAIPGGMILSVIYNQQQYNAVDVLTIHSDQMSSPFTFVVVLSVSKLKQVSNITFSPN